MGDFFRFQVDEVFDDGGFQRVTGRGLNGERFDRDFALTRLQGHGLSTVPKPGAVGLAVALDGDRRRAFLLGLESTGDRPKNGKAGETVLYGPNGEALSIVKNNIRVVVGTFTVVGTVVFEGSSVMHNGVEIGSTHRHGGVIPGGGQTGVPA